MDDPAQGKPQIPIVPPTTTPPLEVIPPTPQVSQPVPEVPPFTPPTQPPQEDTPPPPVPQQFISPTPPPMQPEMDQPRSHGSKKVVLIVIALIIGLTIIGLSIFLSMKYLAKDKNTISSNSTTTTLSKYAADTDGDGVPDAIETGAGLDPAISEITRCAPKDCALSDAASADHTQNNILFIIDSSGSMGTTIGNQTKMDLAKEAIRNFLKNTATNVNVGIMIYGNKGSNSATDKAVSCASADMVASIGSVNSSTVDSYLSQINPVGWTPIGLAITKGKDAFVGKEGQKNQIIVVTDGAETCDTNPTGAATDAKNSIYQIRVDVIGFAVTAADQSSLQAISTNGGGIFSVASNADDLLNQMQTNLKNFQNFQSDATCIADSYNTSIDCLTEAKNKVVAYISTLEVGLTGTAWSEVATLKTNILDIFTKKIYALQDEESALMKKASELVN